MPKISVVCKKTVIRRELVEIPAFSVDPSGLTPPIYRFYPVLQGGYDVLFVLYRCSRDAGDGKTDTDDPSDFLPWQTDADRGE